MVFTEHVKRSIKSGGKDEKEIKDVASTVICENVVKMVEDDDNEEPEAPEGGWGWMVALGMVIAYIPSLTPSGSFTVIFGDFLESTGQVGYATSLINALFNISFSVASVLTNKLMKTFSMRSVGIFAAIIFALPNIMYALIDWLSEMAILSFIQGAGCGIIVTICHTNISSYFNKRRTVVVNVCQTIVSIGGIGYVLCVEKLMKAYGFRGTAALAGAFSLNCIVGMSLMWPVEMTTKDKKKTLAVEEGTVTEKIKLVLPSEAIEDSEISERKSLHGEVPARELMEKSNLPNGWNSLRSLKDDAPVKFPLIRDMDTRTIMDVESGTVRQRSNSVLITGWQDSRKNALMAGLSMSSTSLRIPPGSESLCQAMTLRSQSKTQFTDEQNEEAASESHGKFAKPWYRSSLFNDLINVEMLKDKWYLNSCFGISFVFASDFTFAALVPLMLTDLGYDKSTAAYTVTYSSSGELLSRVALCLFTAFVDLNPKRLFFTAMTAMIFAKIGFMYFSYSVNGVLVFSVLIGALRSWMMVAQPLIISYNVPREKLAPACGMFALISGLTSLIFGPLGGTLKDWTGTYHACQIALIAMNILFVPLWVFEMWARRNE